MDLINDILDLGDAMLAALHAEDYEALLEAVRQREALVAQMKAEGLRPNPKVEGIALQAQHDALSAVLLAREHSLGETLGGMRQFRSAQQRYVQRPLRRRILNQQLHG